MKELKDKFEKNKNNESYELYKDIKVMGLKGINYYC